MSSLPEGRQDGPAIACDGCGAEAGVEDFCGRCYRTRCPSCRAVPCPCPSEGAR